nr:retrotransposon protein, putative, Ty1-copia subclass [Tanacetum cinerariifolium]
MTTSSANNSVFRGFFEKQKLTGPNFIDWYRQLRIVLSIEDKLNYLEQPIPPTLVVPAGQHVAPEILTAHTDWIKGSKEIQAEQELLQTTRDFHSCKQEEGQSVSSYVLKMKGYIDNLEHLGHLVTLGFGVSLILIGLCKEFDGFVQNYNMYSLGKTIIELRAMLKLHEKTLPKNNALSLHAIRAGHWKRNCPQYLAELLKKKKNAASGAGGSGSKGKSTRTRHAPYCMCIYIDAEEHKLGDLGEPANYKAALLDPKSKKWLNAMNVEMQSMKDNDVWVLVEPPPNGKTVGSKRLFKKKTDMDGVVHTYKARLVAKDYTQTLGIDYEETFSPVANIRAIGILIAIVAYYDYEIWQMVVKTAFLNGYLNEEVYMEQPEGFVNPKYPNRLKRSIYGLKQASRQWNKRFDDEIKKFSFTQNRDEPCIYLKASGRNITFLILYVDDILIMENNIPMLQGVKSYLGRCFAMKDFGKAEYILGIKIYRDRSWRLIGLCQSAYIEKILKRYCIKNSKRKSIPMQKKLKLSKSQGASTPAELKRMQNVPYASAMGFIMYVVRCTRPEAIAISNESGIIKGARHFRAKVHYIRKFIEYGDVKLEKVYTDDNLADPFTKALAFLKHSEHTRNIRMLPSSSLM